MCRDAQEAEPLSVQGRGMTSDERSAPASAPPLGRALRAIASVAGGYLVFALSAVALFQLSGRDSHAPQPLGFETGAVVFGMVFAALGGYLAARVAATRPRAHAGGVAVVLALGAGVSLVMSPGAGATWSQWTALLLMAPSAYLGGHLVMRPSGGSVSETT